MSAQIISAPVKSMLPNQSMAHRTMAIFRAATTGVGKELPSADFLLVQHVPELFFGIAFEPHKFESKSLPIFPPDDRKGNDN